MPGESMLSSLIAEWDNNTLYFRSLAIEIQTDYNKNNTLKVISSKNI